MILEFTDGREFDTEKEDDMMRLGRLLRDTERMNAQFLGQIAQLRGDLRAAIDKPLPSHDNSDVVAAVERMHADVMTGLSKVVRAQLADTILKRDPVSGDPERSIKVVRG